MSNIQKMRFWGTGAGEGIPTPFCRCRVCEYARMNKGKDLRTRSSFRIDEKVMIDIGADFFAQSIMYLEDTFDVSHVLYTHTHHDHFNKYMLWLRSIKRDDNRPKEPIHLYFSREGAKILESVYKNPASYLREDFVQFHALDFYETYQIGDYKVTPLKGHHETDIENFAANYLIEFKSGKKMYYALDSGLYLEETFEYLKNIKIDLLIGECTFPIEKNSNAGHMTLTDEKLTLDRLWKQGTINKDTKIYLTHISGLERTHDEIAEYWDSLSTEYKVNVAYDGLSVMDEINMF